MTPPEGESPDADLVDGLARSMVLLHGGHDDQDDHHHGTGRGGAAEVHRLTLSPPDRAVRSP